MKQIIIVWIMGLALIVGSGRALADASATLDVASAYVFRGVTFNDGLVFQPGVEVSLYGVTVGAWGNLDIGDYDGALEKGQFSEIDLYLGYEIPVEFVSLSLGYTEYTYPGAEGDADREIAIGIALDLPLAPALTVYYGVDGAIEKSLYIEAGIGHSIALTDALTIDIGATVGYADSDGGESGFSDYALTAGLSYGILGASISSIGQLDDEVLPDGAYDVELVGMVSLAFAL